MSIEVVQCTPPGAVDLISSDHQPEGEVLHCSAAEWLEFVAAVKAGRFDHLTPGGLFHQEAGLADGGRQEYRVSNCNCSPIAEMRK